VPDEYNAVAMNLFTGMTNAEIVSLALAFVLFNFYVVLEAAALAAFYFASRPHRGQVRSAAIWHVIAAFLFMMSLVSTVWAAPAEKSFVNETGSSLGTTDRFVKVVVGLIFAAIGITSMVVGLTATSRQRRAAQQRALLEG